MTPEDLLREHIRRMEALFEEWRQLCREKGWKSGLSK